MGTYRSIEVLKLFHAKGRRHQEGLDVSCNSISNFLVSLLVTFPVSIEDVKPERCLFWFKLANVKLSKLLLIVKVMTGQSKSSLGQKKISGMFHKSAIGNLCKLTVIKLQMPVQKSCENANRCTFTHGSTLTKGTQSFYKANMQRMMKTFTFYQPKVHGDKPLNQGNTFPKQNKYTYYWPMLYFHGSRD